MSKHEFINDICEAKDDKKKLYELVYKYKVAFADLGGIALELVTDTDTDTDTENNKKDILRLLEANNLRFFKRTNTLIEKGYSLEKYADVFFDEIYSISEEALREYQAQVYILDMLDISLTTQVLVNDVCNEKYDLEQILVNYKSYSLEELEDNVVLAISKRSYINKKNILRLLEANNLDFCIRLNKIIFNTYTLIEYFKKFYYEEYLKAINSNKAYFTINPKVPIWIKNEYKNYIDIIEYAGISLQTQVLVNDICSAGTDKIKFAELLSKYKANNINNLEKKLLKEISAEDNYVNVQNYKRMFAENNLDFFKKANNIASNGYSLKEYNKLVSCKTFVHASNNVASSVKELYDKYIKAINYANIPFKTHQIDTTENKRTVVRRFTSKNIMKV